MVVRYVLWVLYPAGCHTSVVGARSFRSSSTGSAREPFGFRFSCALVQRPRIWVAVKELRLDFHNPKTICIIYHISIFW